MFGTICGGIKRLGGGIKEPLFRAGDIFIAFLAVFGIVCCLSPYLSAYFPLIGIICAALFVPKSGNINFSILLLAETVFTAVFAVFSPFSILIYIIYVETGIILFFIIKYSSEKMYFWILRFAAAILLILSLLPSRFVDKAPFMVAFLPWTFSVLNGKARKYFYAFVILYLCGAALALIGKEALIAGFLGAGLTAISGEVYLLPIIALSFPASIGISAQILKSGVKGGNLAQGIVWAGFFLWKYGFSGNVSESFGESLKNIYETSGVFEVFYGSAKIIGVIFFWYVLRLARSVLVKIISGKRKNKRFLRSGLGSIVGFSLYTFIAYNASKTINIVVYLVCAALLRRAFDLKQKREESKEKQRKTDFGF